jgi:hypothetical protein
MRSPSECASLTRVLVIGMVEQAKPMVEKLPKSFRLTHHLLIFAFCIAGCSSSPSETTADVDVSQNRSQPDVEQPDAQRTVISRGSDITEPPPTDADVAIDIPSCTPTATGIILPIWIAGQSGTPEETGSFGKPDAIFIDERGYLLAGDEHDDYEEIHIYDLDSDNPEIRGDALESLIDLGVTGGGAGEMEFRAISGFAQDRVSGDLYVVEQGNGRIQILSPLDEPDQAPYYSFKAFFGGFAADKDHPDDEEFVRLQAARTDSLQRLFISDDAKSNAISARRDIQVFDADLEFLFKFGDSSYGALGSVGNLKEPENFVIDEARNRIYVCDEGPGNVVIYRYDDLSFISRLEGFSGPPNGIDIDQYGYLYIVDEGSNGQSDIRVFDPDTLEEVIRFGEGSNSHDLAHGTFSSPDTLIINISKDLLVLAFRDSRPSLHSQVTKFDSSHGLGRYPDHH